MSVFDVVIACLAQGAIGGTAGGWGEERQTIARARPQTGWVTHCELGVRIVTVGIRKEVVD